MSATVTKTRFLHFLRFEENMIGACPCKFTGIVHEHLHMTSPTLICDVPVAQ